MDNRKTIYAKVSLSRLDTIDLYLKAAAATNKDYDIHTEHVFNTFTIVEDLVSPKRLHFESDFSNGFFMMWFPSPLVCSLGIEISINIQICGQAALRLCVMLKAWYKSLSWLDD